MAVARVGEVFIVKRQREREREREREMEIDEVCNELKDQIEAADSCNDVSILLRRVRLHPFSFIYQRKMVSQSGNLGVYKIKHIFLVF